MKALITTTVAVALLVTSQIALASNPFSTDENKNLQPKNKTIPGNPVDVSDIVENYWNPWEISADELGHAELFGNK